MTDVWQETTDISYNFKKKTIELRDDDGQVVVVIPKNIVIKMLSLISEAETYEKWTEE